LLRPIAAGVFEYGDCPQSSESSLIRLEDASGRHARYCITTLSVLNTQLDEILDDESTDWLRCEIENIQSAFEWTTAKREVSTEAGVIYEQLGQGFLELFCKMMRYVTAKETNNASKLTEKMHKLIDNQGMAEACWQVSQYYASLSNWADAIMFAELARPAVEHHIPQALPDLDSAVVQWRVRLDSSL
jgi:hypothetical protein